MSVKATKLRRTLQAYSDYASRNWPMWWSLKLGMPLGYALAIVLLTSIIGSTVDVRVPQTLDPLAREYVSCQKKCLASDSASASASHDHFETRFCIYQCVPSELQPILERGRQVMQLLTYPPIVTGVLFSFLWFFYIARSFKFTNAPLLGRQPGVLPLALLGCGLLWAGLAGLKVLQWRNYSIGVFDFTSFGRILPNTIIPDETYDDYESYGTTFRGESDAALLALMIGSTFVSYGAVFLVLYRQSGIGTALSGLVFKISWLGLIGTVTIMQGIGVKDSDFLKYLLAAPLFIPPLIGLYVLFSGHRVRGLSTLGISTLLYLVSFGPMWLYLGSGIGPWLLEFLKGKQIIFYFICFMASVIACEVLAWLLHRHQLRPR
jgi:hypothetical protein